VENCGWTESTCPVGSRCLRIALHGWEELLSRLKLLQKPDTLARASLLLTIRQFEDTLVEIQLNRAEVLQQLERLPPTAAA
jgi:hypothetical protein